MIKIIVDSQEIKDELIAESEYIHYYVEEGYVTRFGKKVLFGLDSEKAGMLMHIYMNPDIIEVVNTNQKNKNAKDSF